MSTIIIKSILTFLCVVIMGMGVHFIMDMLLLNDIVDINRVFLILIGYPIALHYCNFYFISDMYNIGVNNYFYCKEYVSWRVKSDILKIYTIVLLILYPTITIALENYYIDHYKCIFNLNIVNTCVYGFKISASIANTIYYSLVSVFVITIHKLKY